MLMNRIGPSASELYIANADGSGERKLLQNSVFEHNASFLRTDTGLSPDPPRSPMAKLQLCSSGDTANVAT